MLVEGSIEVHEVGVESACCHLTGQGVEVVVGVFGEVAYTALLLPYLNGEDGCRAIAHTLVSRLQQLANDAASLSRSIGTIVYRRKNHLIATARMDSVHIMDECLHGLVYAVYRTVDGMLAQALVALQEVELASDIVIDGRLIQMGQVHIGKLLDILEFFNVTLAHIGSKIEIKSRDGLTTMHFVLYRLH